MTTLDRLIKAGTFRYETPDGRTVSISEPNASIDLLALIDAVMTRHDLTAGDIAAIGLSGERVAVCVVTDEGDRWIDA